MNDDVILATENLAVSYGTGRGRFAAVRGMNLTLTKGSTLGLVGESGSGKSTLGRAVAGLEKPSNGTIATAQGVRVGMVFQNPRASFNPRMSVRAALLEASETVPAGRRTHAPTDIGHHLERVGLPTDTLDRYPHQFSGGQLQRIAIARALASQPDLLVLDEVTSALDVGVQAEILRLLRDIQRTLHLTYLFISHDLPVVARMADTVAVLYLGKVLEHGPTELLFNQPRHPYTRALLDSAPRFGTPPKDPELVAGAEIPDPRTPPDGCPYVTRCPRGPLAHPDRGICLDQPPSLTPEEGTPPSLATGHATACHFPLSPIIPGPPQET